MQKSSLLIFFILVLAVILYGCGKEDETLQPRLVPVQEDITEVQVIASCDDENPCTEDIFNNLTNQCEHRILNQCCGDGTCDADERCSEETHQTVCPNDCPQQCPAFVTLSDWTCNGSCVVAPDHYLIDGNTKFTVALENIGELGLANVVSDFRCVRSGTSYFFFSDRDEQPRSGVLFKDYFNNNEESVYLSGTPYGRNTAIYTFEIVGAPTENINLVCNINLRANNFLASKELVIKLSSV